MPTSPDSKGAFLMPRPVCLTLTTALWLVAGTSFYAPGQEPKDIVLEGQVKLGVHKFKLDDRSVYQVEVQAKGFVPNVRLGGHILPGTTDSSNKANTFRGMFVAPKSAEYTLTIAPNSGSGAPEGLLDYTLMFKTMKVDETPLLKKEDKLTPDDPKYANPKFSFYKGPFKEYPLTMKAGRIYVIDLAAAKGKGNELLPLVLLEAPSKMILGQSYSDPTARIVFRATTDGEYRVVAATSYLTKLGAYTLTVRTVKDEK
jgi:hypothetical protein